MSSSTPACRTVNVLAFSGDRSPAFAAQFQQSIDEVRKGRGHGPSLQDCLLYAGHAGVSTSGHQVIYGFNPESANTTVWQLLDGLKNGDAFPGVVRDDTAMFAAAQNHGLTILSFDILLPEPQFHKFEVQLDSERRYSQYLYGFSNGDGDCNCITWLERLGLPLLTGRMDEFVAVSGVVSRLGRRFGRCL